MFLFGQAPGFIQHTIDLDFNGIHRVKVVDLDFDGDLDIVGGSEHTPYTTSKGLAWWRNDGGYPIIWTRFTIDLMYRHVMSVDVACINNDTFPDIVASSWENGKLCWWQNSGDPTQNWIRHDIVNGWINAHDAQAYDIDDDGNMDVVGVSAGNNKIAVFYNQGGVIPTWDEQVVTAGFYHALSATIADLNSNGYPDIIGAADGADAIAWWDNLGGNPIDWQQFTIASSFSGSARTDAIDINLDDQPDILGVGWEGNEIAYWICNDITTNSWTKNIITDQLVMASDARGRDIDLDDDIDIVAIGKVPGKLVIYVNDNFVFTKHILNPDLQGAGGLAVVDLDQDGDQDIIAGSGIDGDLYFYENTTIVGIADPISKQQTSGFSVFPNPASRYVTISADYPENETLSCRIYTTEGNLVDQRELNPENNKINQRLDVTFLPAGVYLIVIFSGDFQRSAKIVIHP
ncbi:MAG: T9SS type A sorting domain-containing protein [Bacteroidetes bacterium]|nr:T9SS type A sorting domain-containing protein [Bacteroidota bacterium]